MAPPPLVNPQDQPANSDVVFYKDLQIANSRTQNGCCNITTLVNGKLPTLFLQSEYP